MAGNLAISDSADHKSIGKRPDLSVGTPSAIRHRVQPSQRWDRWKLKLEEQIRGCRIF